MLEALNKFSPLISAIATIVIAAYAIVSQIQSHTLAKQNHVLQKQIRTSTAAQVATNVLGQVAANKGSISQGIAEFKKHFKDDLDIFK